MKKGIPILRVWFGSEIARGATGEATTRQIGEYCEGRVTMHFLFGFVPCLKTKNRREEGKAKKNVGVREIPPQLVKQPLILVSDKGAGRQNSHCLSLDGC